MTTTTLPKPMTERDWWEDRMIGAGTIQNDEAVQYQLAIAARRYIVERRLNV